ncbi:MAG: response regulator transcription factor [Deltaproteobacteria bacterium]|nr:response regulator transcription factor [Deltaproteobacteria bacterium]
MESYSIVLADDHTMFREGIKKIIGERIGMEVVREAGSGLELLKLLKEMTPDMVILDISMPGIGGIEATQEIKSTYSGVKVLILSMHDDKEYLHHTISAGADGYLLKKDADTELFSAIYEIQRGNTYISPLLSKVVTEDFVQLLRVSNQSKPAPLSLREIEVLKLISDGKTSKEIAGILFISPRTVDNHRANIMEKLNLRNIPALIKYAIHKGYASPNT